MNRDAFEKLVSDWLDRRDDAELAALLADAVAASPERRAVIDEWERFDALLRGLAAPLPVDWAQYAARVAAVLRAPEADATDAGGDAAEDAADAALVRLAADTTHVEPRVDWTTFVARVADAIRSPDSALGDARAAPALSSQEEGDASVDRLVARATVVESRVAWSTYADHVAGALRTASAGANAGAAAGKRTADQSARTRIIRGVGWRRAGARAGLATAAALALFWFVRPPLPAPRTDGGTTVAMVDVQATSPTSGVDAPPAGAASVDVAVADEALPPEAPAIAQAPRETEPEMLVVIEPAADTGPLVAYNDPYGLF